MAQPKATKVRPCKKHVIDENGEKISTKALDPVAVKADQVVEKAFRIIGKLPEKIEVDKVRIVDLMNEYDEYVATIYNTDVVPDSDISVIDFAEKRKIEIKFTTYIDVDDRMKLALSLMKEFIDEKLKKVEDDDLKKLFKMQVKINIETITVQTLIQYKKYDFADERWKKAMTIINDSLKITKKKPYLRIYEKDTDTKSWKSVTLSWNN